MTVQEKDKLSQLIYLAALEAYKLNQTKIADIMSHAHKLLNYPELCVD